MLVRVNKLNLNPSERVSACQFEKLAAKELVRVVSTVECLEDEAYSVQTDHGDHHNSSNIDHNDVEQVCSEFNNSEYVPHSALISRTFQRASRGRPLGHAKFKSMRLSPIKHPETLKVTSLPSPLRNEVDSKNLLTGSISERVNDHPADGASKNGTHCSYMVRDKFFFKFKESFIKNNQGKELIISLEEPEDHGNRFFEGVRTSSFNNFEKQFQANLKKMKNTSYSSSSDDEDEILYETILKEKCGIPHVLLLHNSKNMLSLYKSSKKNGHSSTDRDLWCNQQEVNSQTALKVSTEVLRCTNSGLGTDIQENDSVLQLDAVSQFSTEEFRCTNSGLGTDIQENDSVLQLDAVSKFSTEEFRCTNSRLGTDIQENDGVLQLDAVSKFSTEEFRCSNSGISTDIQENEGVLLRECCSSSVKDAASSSDDDRTLSPDVAPRNCDMDQKGTLQEVTTSFIEHSSVLDSNKTCKFTKQQGNNTRSSLDTEKENNKVDQQNIIFSNMLDNVRDIDDKEGYLQSQMAFFEDISSDSNSYDTIIMDSSVERDHKCERNTSSFASVLPFSSCAPETLIHENTIVDSSVEREHTLERNTSSFASLLPLSSSTPEKLSHENTIIDTSIVEQEHKCETNSSSFSSVLSLSGSTPEKPVNNTIIIDRSAERENTMERNPSSLASVLSLSSSTPEKLSHDTTTIDSSEEREHKCERNPSSFTSVLPLSSSTPEKLTHDTIKTDSSAESNHKWQEHSTSLGSPVPISSSPLISTTALNIAIVESLPGYDNLTSMTSKSIDKCADSNVQVLLDSPHTIEISSSDLPLNCRSDHTKPPICLNDNELRDLSQILSTVATHGIEFPEFSERTNDNVVELTSKKNKSIIYESDETTIELDMSLDVPSSNSIKNSFEQQESSKASEPGGSNFIDKSADSDNDLDTSISSHTCRRQKKHGKVMKKSKRDKGSQLVNRRQLMDENNSSSNDEVNIVPESYACSTNKCLRQRKETLYTYYSDMLDSTEDDSVDSSDEDFVRRGSQRKGCKNKKLKGAGLKEKHKLFQTSVDSGKVTKSGHKARPSRGKKKKTPGGDKLLNSLSLLHMATLASLTEVQPDSLGGQFMAADTRNEHEHSVQYSDQTNNDYNAGFTPGLEHLSFISPQNSEDYTESPSVTCPSANMMNWKQTRTGNPRYEDIPVSRRLLNSSRLASLRPGRNGASNLGSRPIPFSRLMSHSASPVPSNFIFNHISDPSLQSESARPNDDAGTSNTLQLLETRRAQVNCASFSMKDILRLTTPDDSMDSDSKDTAALVRPPEPKRAQVKSTTLSMSDILKLTCSDKNGDTENNTQTPYSLVSSLSNPEPSNAAHLSIKNLDVSDSQVSQQYPDKSLTSLRILQESEDNQFSYTQEMAKVKSDTAVSLAKVMSDTIVSLATNTSNSEPPDESSEASQSLLSQLTNFRRSTVTHQSEQCDPTCCTTNPSSYVALHDNILIQTVHDTNEIHNLMDRTYYKTSNSGQISDTTVHKTWENDTILDKTVHNTRENHTILDKTVHNTRENDTILDKTVHDTKENDTILDKTAHDTRENHTILDKTVHDTRENDKTVEKTIDTKIEIDQISDGIIEDTREIGNALDKIDEISKIDAALVKAVQETKENFTVLDKIIDETVKKKIQDNPALSSNKDLTTADISDNHGTDDDSYTPTCKKAKFLENTRDIPCEIQSHSTGKDLSHLSTLKHVTPDPPVLKVHASLGVQSTCEQMLPSSLQTSSGVVLDTHASPENVPDLILEFSIQDSQEELSENPNNKVKLASTVSAVLIPKASGKEESSFVSVEKLSKLPLLNVPKATSSSLLEIPVISITYDDAPTVEEIECHDLEAHSGQANREEHISENLKKVELKPLHPLQIPPYSFIGHNSNSQPGQVFRTSLNPSLYYPYCWQWPFHTPGSDSTVSPLNLCTIKTSPNNYSPITPTSPISPSPFHATSASASEMSPPMKKSKALWYPWLTVDSARNRSESNAMASQRDYTRHDTKFVNQTNCNVPNINLRSTKSDENASREPWKKKADTKLVSVAPNIYSSRIADLLSNSSHRPNSVKISNDKLSKCQTVSQFLGTVIETAYNQSNNTTSTGCTNTAVRANLKVPVLTKTLTKNNKKKAVRSQVNENSILLDTLWNGRTEIPGNSMESNQIREEHHISYSRAFNEKTLRKSDIETSRKSQSEDTSRVVICKSEHKWIRAAERADLISLSPPGSSLSSNQGDICNLSLKDRLKTNSSPNEGGSCSLSLKDRLTTTLSPNQGGSCSLSLKDRLKTNASPNRGDSCSLSLIDRLKTDASPNRGDSCSLSLKDRLKTNSSPHQGDSCSFSLKDQLNTNLNPKLESYSLKDRLIAKSTLNQGSSNCVSLKDRLITKLIRGDNFEYHPQEPTDASRGKKPANSSRDSNNSTQNTNQNSKETLQQYPDKKQKEDEKGEESDRNKDRQLNKNFASEGVQDMTLRPVKPPPTRSTIEESLHVLGLNSVQPPVAFCSSLEDLPDRPGARGRVLKVESKRVCELSPFTTSQHIIGVKIWRAQSLSSTKLLASQSQDRSLSERLQQEPQLRFLLAGEHLVVVSPVCIPPSFTSVKKWLYDKLDNISQAKSGILQTKVLESSTVNNANTDNKFKKGGNINNLEMCVEHSELNSSEVCLQKEDEQKESKQVLNLSLSQTGSSQMSRSDDDSSAFVDTDLDISATLIATPALIITPTVTSNLSFTTPSSSTVSQEAADLIPPAVVSKPCRKRKLRFADDSFQDMSMETTSLDLNPLDKHLREIRTRDVALPPHLNNEDIDQQHCKVSSSTPMKHSVKGLPDLACTPICSRQKDAELSTSVMEAETVESLEQPTSNLQTPILRHISTNTENLLRRTILTSQTQRHISALGIDEVSQIEGPTPKNSFGFKVVQTGMQGSKALHKYQYVTAMSLELHIETRGDLRPDPEFDAVQVIFYSVLNDIPPEKGQRSITGAIVVDLDSWIRTTEMNKQEELSINTVVADMSSVPSTSHCAGFKDSLTVSDQIISGSSSSSSPPTKPSFSLSNQAAISISSPQQQASKPQPSTPQASTSAAGMNGNGRSTSASAAAAGPASDTLLNKCGIEGLDVTYVKDEMDLISVFTQLVVQLDPDILVGFEIQMLSWGYLLQRAAHLNVDMCSGISRVQDAKSDNRFSAEKDEWGADHMSEIHVAGRIVLNLWRVLRHEVTLNVYSFENVAYHVLHHRIPLYSFRSLSKWYSHKTHLHRWRVFEHYSRRVKGELEIIDQLDLIGKTSEFARVFGLEFYDVLARGSQIRVESMMLRLAKPMNFIPVSPSVNQRARSRAAECIQLNLEPESKYYTSPVAVLDFQSLYPSIMIAYNYCFTTCLGRLDLLEKAHEGPFEFGCTSLHLTPAILNKIRDHVTVSPNGVAFLKSSVRRGVLPIMVEEILNTRLMVKKSMKKYKDDKILSRMLDARQLSLKLIANVTYGYTGANFSGRMPCIEVGDSIVRKARESLERAIELVETTAKWRAHVVYGDTDSMFIHLPGRSKDEAFVLGQEIADAVTAMFPSPIKLRFEKVYLPCVLQSKKRYVGFMYETPDQKEPVYDAKGIETVRRDSCSAVSKILERSIKVLFSTHDLSRVKTYVSRQLHKLLEGKVSIIDLIFAKEYRGMMGYKPGACVPALEIARKRLRLDRRSEPRVGERVPYVIVHGSPGLPLIQLVKEPSDLVTDTSLRLNAHYYVTKQILPPLDRIFSLIGVSVFKWYVDMPKVVRVAPMIGAPSSSKQGTISQFFATTNCPVCDVQTKKLLCESCARNPQLVVVALTTKIRDFEKTTCRLAQVCDACQGSQDCDQMCVSIDCPIMFRRIIARQDLSRADNLQEVLKKYLTF